jgi:hypothetical protein
MPPSRRAPTPFWCPRCTEWPSSTAKPSGKNARRPVLATSCSTSAATLEPIVKNGVMSRPVSSVSASTASIPPNRDPPGSSRT